MDPDDVLRRLRANAKVLMDNAWAGERIDSVLVYETLELFEALDEWIYEEGALPKDWDNNGS